jgi:hypothetical protein
LFFSPLFPRLRAHRYIGRLPRNTVALGSAASELTTLRGKVPDAWCSVLVLSFVCSVLSALSNEGSFVLPWLLPSWPPRVQAGRKVRDHLFEQIARIRKLADLPAEQEALLAYQSANDFLQDELPQV